MTTRPHRTLISRLIVSLGLLAWSTLGIWGYSPYNRFLSHAGLLLADFVSTKSILLILSGWLLMIVAIMLPTSLVMRNYFVSPISCVIRRLSVMNPIESHRSKETRPSAL